MMSVYWLLAGAVLCILEMITISLTCIWFAGGAVVAAIAAAVGLPLIVQLLLFAIASVLLIFLTRPMAVRYVNQKTKKTNVDALVGQHHRVAETIDPSIGQGKIIIGDVEWGVKPADGSSVIEEGSLVEIVEISGVKLIVEPMEEEYEEVVEETIEDNEIEGNEIEDNESKNNT